MVTPLVPVPSPFPNIEFPKPYWVNQLKSLVTIGCLDPALMYVELALPAALEAAWTIATPSTKQLIQETTGKSWVCQAKTIFSDAEKATPLANNTGTRFMYGLWRGLDVFTYFQFMGDVVGQGLINWNTMVNKYEQRCTGTESHGRGKTTLYGAPWFPGVPTWTAGPTWINEYGEVVAAPGFIAPGGVWTFIAWFSLQGLDTSGVEWNTRIRNTSTGTIYDACYTNTIDDPGASAIVCSAGAWPHDSPPTGIALEVEVTLALNARIVASGGGCYSKVSGN